MELLIHHQKTRRPTLAILTHSDDKRIFRGNQENYIDLISSGEEKGVHVYVMTTADFKLTAKHAVGYSYNSKLKTWKKELLPLPHVIYNRIPYRKFEQLPEVQPILQSCIRHRQIRFFNPSFFNKWTLFEWLNKSKETGLYIPATQKLTTSDELEKWLHKHSNLYLKPIRGKAGKGIMKVSYIIEKTSKVPKYQLSVQDKTKSHISRYPNVTQLWNQINQMMVTQDYIMQQGIPLSLYRHRPFDLRVLAQKNGKGIWTIAGVGARLAGRLSITTHVPRGGSIDDPIKLLGAGFGALGSKRILKRAKAASLVIVRQIEKASGSTLGEMSLDLGVDTAGHIWFFEANSKPMKFDEPHIRKKSLDNLMNYCIYLSKRPKKEVNTSAKRTVKRAMKTTANKAR